VSGGLAMLAASKTINEHTTVAPEGFDQAANALGLEDNVRAILKFPEHIFTVSTRSVRIAAGVSEFVNQRRLARPGGVIPRAIKEHT
jgi:hypothetical protein